MRQQVSHWVLKAHQISQKNLLGFFVKFDGPVFSGGFWQISLKLSLYVKNWRKQNAFFSILGLIKSSPNSLGPPGTLWDPFGPPLGGPRGGIKVGVQQERCWDHYSKQLSCSTLTLIPPLGPSGGPREFGEDPSRPKIEKNAVCFLQFLT